MANSVFNLQPGTLENDLIKITPLTESDFERLYQVASDPLIWEQHPQKDRYKKEVFQLFFHGAVSSKSSFLVFEKSTNKLIGSTRYYDYDPLRSKIAIGFTFLAREYWGGQYNKAMKMLLLDYAFQNVESVRFHIGATNIRSQKAILKIGAKKISEMNLDLNGIKLLHFEYEIKRQDWQNNK
ncbi:MAG TPA: GNAT family N-acetyltransferase [Chitinophagaceae bacterium]|jgi:hypothetical protein